MTDEAVVDLIKRAQKNGIPIAGGKQYKKRMLQREKEKKQ